MPGGLAGRRAGRQADGKTGRRADGQTGRREDWQTEGTNNSGHFCVLHLSDTSSVAVSVCWPDVGSGSDQWPSPHPQSMSAEAKKLSNDGYGIVKIQFTWTKEGKVSSFEFLPFGTHFNGG